MDAEHVALTIEHANLKGTIGADLTAIAARVNVALAALAAGHVDIATEKLTFALADIAASQRTVA
jgi:hypothetical protein